MHPCYHVGTPIFFKEGNGIVFQLRCNGIHHNREGNHVACHIHCMAIEGRNIFAVHDRIKIGHLTPFAVYINFLAKVAFPISRNRISTFRTAGQRPPLHILPSPNWVCAIQAKRNGKACAWLVKGLKGIGSPVLKVNFACLLVFYLKYHKPRVTELVQHEVINIIKEIVSVRGNGKVLFMVNSLVPFFGTEQVLAQIIVPNAVQNKPN